MAKFKKGDLVRRFKCGSHGKIKIGDTFIVYDVKGINSNELSDGDKDSSYVNGFWNDIDNLELVKTKEQLEEEAKERIIDNYPIF